MNRKGWESVFRAVRDRLKGSAYHFVQKASHVLGRGKAHSDAGRHLGYPFVVGVDYSTGKAEVDNSVMLSGFGYDVHEVNRGAAVANFPPLASDRQLSATADYYRLIAHRILAPSRIVDEPRLSNANEDASIDAGALEGDLTSYVKNDLNEGRGPRH